MGINEQNIDLEIDGMGIVMYSSETVKGIEEGYDYLMNEYSDPAKVAAHLKKGDMVGFCTGSGGRFILKLRNGYPDASVSESNPIAIRLGIEVRDERICFIDLFWLSEWYDNCPSEQTIAVPNGFYHVTVLTHKPKSGIWGDDQEIYIYLNRLSEMPQLSWSGVPQLFTE